MDLTKRKNKIFLYSLVLIGSSIAIYSQEATLTIKIISVLITLIVFAVIIQITPIIMKKLNIPTKHNNKN
jgi:hypothetical protein